MDLNFEAISITDAPSANNEDDKLSLTRTNSELNAIMKTPSPRHHHQQREVMPLIPITPAVSEYSIRRHLIKKRKLPSSSDMVQTAFLHLAVKPRQSLSLYAIRKFISNYYLPTEHSLVVRMRYVKQYIHKALKDGVLKQLSGNGLNGSFRFIGKQSDKRRQLQQRKQKQMTAKARNYNSKRKVNSKNGKIQK